MNNYHFDVTADIQAANTIISVLGFAEFHKAYGYRVRPAGTFKNWREERAVPTRLIMYWHDSDIIRRGGDFVAFAEPLLVAEATQFIIHWLELNEPDEDEPDMDGHCSKGFRIWNEEYGRIEDDDYAFVAVTPVWAEYHK